MTCFAVPLLALVVLGADQKLIPSARIETGAEIDLAKVSRDGKTLVGRVKDGNGYDLVIWDIPSRSTTILVKGADALGFSILSDRSGLFACICNNHGKGLHDVDYFIWDIANKSKTKLIRLEELSSRRCPATGPRMEAFLRSRMAIRRRSTFGSATGRRNGPP